jgi:hypothetical protein
MGRDVWTGCEEGGAGGSFEWDVNRCRRKERGEKGKAEGLFNRLSTG